jgi:phenylalanine-4-hydroxylase
MNTSRLVTRTLRPIFSTFQCPLISTKLSSSSSSSSPSPSSFSLSSSSSSSSSLSTSSCLHHTSLRFHTAPASASASASASAHDESLKSQSSQAKPVIPVKDRLKKKVSLRFTLPDSPGSLQQALQFFTNNNISLTRVESRPNKRSADYDFYVDFVGDLNSNNVSQAMKELKTHARDIHILESKRVHWFPRRIRDLDLIANRVLEAGDDLQSDHPGFNDPAYRARRKEITQNALNYRHGEKVPKINYTPEETATWNAVWDQLMPLLQKHACVEHQRLLPLLMENCGYAANNIPQVEDISQFLKECTGFTIRPVAGLLSARDFLYGLAFRTFFSTQYLRHHSRPLYTPEPDLVHELLGHAPLFADQDFADFSQEIGLASIGATDEQILKLSRCYWFSVEFGLCLQNGERKAYGAGLLSSFGELEYSMSDKPKIKDWDPFKAGEQDYPITEYQPLYFIAKSFDDAKAKLQAYSSSFARPFNVRYNPYTQSIEVDSNISVDDDTYA